MKKAFFILGMFVIVSTIYIFTRPYEAYEQVSELTNYYKTFEQGNILLHVADESTFQAEEVLDEIVRTRDFAEQLFSIELSGHEPISIFVTLSGYDGHSRLIDLAGAYYPDDRIILINGEDEQFSRATAVHEYSHFLFDLYLERIGLTIESVPAWFREGLAEYFTLMIEGSLSHYYTYYFGASPFEELHLNNPKLLNTVYLQGFYAVYQLIETYGAEAIPKFMQAFQQTNDFAHAFHKVTGLDYYTYHELFAIDYELLNSTIQNSANPTVLLAEAELLLVGQASINPYTPFVLPYTIDAAIQLGQVEQAKLQFQNLKKLLYNPSTYLIYMDYFVEIGELDFAQEIAEKARELGRKYCYDLSVFESELDKLGL